MAGITRRPAARRDLIDIWLYIADDNEAAADRFLDRIQTALKMLLENPLAGRTRSELIEGLRSFPVGNYILFYRPAPGGIELIRALSGYRDFQPEDVV